MQLKKATGKAQPTQHTKNLIAEAEYAKGKAFLGAALLLRQRGNSKADIYVSLHLLCQGVELILKSVLLGLDYDRFHPQLATKLRHNLLKIADEVHTAIGMAPLNPSLARELHHLDQAFSTHRLRYASAYDVLVNPDSISYAKTLRRTAALVRIIQRNGGLISSLEKLSRP